MFKLVVLCVFAAAVAEPDPAHLYGSPLAYSSYPAVLPAATTIQQPGFIAQPSPLIYSSPYAYSHFIKKRSADPEPEPEAQPEASPEASPEANPEAKPDPLLLTYGSSLYYPNAYTSPIINPFIRSYPYSAYPYSAYPYQAGLPLAPHLIKKRSAQLLTTGFSSPYVPNIYPSYNPYIASPYTATQYGAVDTVVPFLKPHYIKKRSAVLPLATQVVSPYAAIPSTLYNGYYPAVPTTYLGNNYYPSAAVVGLHAIKKRSAQFLAAPGYIAPTTYAGASPIYTSTYAASSPVVSTLPYVASPYAYSTYIKK